MELYYRKMGEGEPLIILHGLYGSSDNWMSVGKKLAGQYQVYLVDQRNHGKSPHSTKHNYYVMRDDLMEFMEKHQIDRATLLGHSMGGKTALFFAVQHPEKLKRLVVLDIAPIAYQMLTNPSSQVLNHLNILNALFNLDVENIGNIKEADDQLAQTIPYQKVRQFLLKNLKRKDSGTFHWLLNVQALRNELPNIMAGLDPDDPNNTLTANDLPILFIKGEK